MAGEYRKPEVLEKLPAEMAGSIRDGSLRIAIAAQPMSGVVPHPDLSERLAAAYGAIAGMEKYVRGLTDGSLVPVVVPAETGSGKVWRPGELFFKS